MIENRNREEIDEKTKQEDQERGKAAYMSTQTKTYVYKCRGLDIKMQTMEIMMMRLEELDKEIDSQSPEEKIKTLAVMAELGKAILPD